MPQGTVKSFDHATHETVVLTDDLVELPVAADTFDSAHLLELRVGQRVRFELVDDDEGGQRVTQLGLVSL